MTDLKALTAEHLAKAKADKNGRSAHMFMHDGPLRQALIALTEGSKLDEHSAPPAASLQVLSGRVRITAGSGDVELGEGGVSPIPHERHGLTALSDAVVVLTTVTNVEA
ncbi:cupin [Actinocorallia sp. A-T 12471]|uniref:cupin n=1 Tax=Actinocorallia sp. A-T 12471 TaxID=3089813 RepID=UPI0029D38CAC|nr:cupin [Actinocorallia sp. A-T 12471]MDX6743489.1 cupin [Actinocorallia sp. A-T 12471]